MATALTMYPASAASSTLSTAEKLVTTTGGTLTTTAVATVGASLGWGELGIGTVVTWAAAGSIGSPSGKGGMCDLALAGNTIAAGTWTAVIPMFVSQSGKTTSGTMVLRFYIYKSGVYTVLGQISQTVNLTSTQTGISFSGSQSAGVFGTSSTAYTDIWYNITSNTMTSGGTINYGFSSSATQGVATSQIVTPGYSPTPATIRRIVYSNTMAAGGVL